MIFLPVMNSLPTHDGIIALQHIKNSNDWTYIHEICYGHCAVGRYSKLILLDCHSLFSDTFSVMWIIYHQMKRVIVEE